MELNVQKRLAAEMLKCSPKRVVFDTERLADIKEAITKEDIRGLISDRAIISIPKKGVSRARAKVRQQKRRAGQRRGYGKRKGKKTARMPGKTAWVSKIRTQRQFLNELREKDMVDSKVFRMLYLKSKSGFFRSIRHMKLYINEHSLVGKGVQAENIQQNKAAEQKQ
jgi:large subunit ribosomal protein L19e